MWISWQVALQAAIAIIAVLCVLTLLRVPRDRRWVHETRSLAAEVARVLLLYALWQFTREKTTTKTKGAMEHARWVWHVEQHLHIATELSIERAFLHHRWLMEAMNGYYAIVHVPLMGAVLVWLYWRHRDRYPRVRNVLAITTGACIAIQNNPVAPPRFMTDLGFVDPALLLGQSVYGANGSGVSNQLAAMPSLHYAWAIIAAGAVITVARSKWRWLILVHVALTALAVTATANHWWLDGIVAGLIAVAAWGLQRAVLGAPQRMPVTELDELLTVATAETDRERAPQPTSAGPADVS